MEKENGNLRARSVVVRSEGSSAAELVSKIMAKSGLAGVGYLTLQSGGGTERALSPKEDVFALVTAAANPRDVVLAFRNAEAADRGSGRRREEDRKSGVGEGDGEEVSVASLEERIAEQEKLIVQLRQIEKEQKKIIDSVSRRHMSEVTSPRGTPVSEVERLTIALEEQKRLTGHQKAEVERLKQQKAQYLKMMKSAGVAVSMRDEMDDRPEESAGCSTNTCNLM